eukprot:scpid81648/ scgid9187/ DNA polymerase kappa; DINB protein
MDDFEAEEDEEFWAATLEQLVDGANVPCEQIEIRTDDDAAGSHMQKSTITCSTLSTQTDGPQATKSTASTGVGVGSCTSGSSGSGGSSTLQHSGTTANQEEAAAGTEGDDSSRWRTALNTHKAGMQGLDKEHVNQIIYEASKNSLYYQNEMKKEKVVEERVARQQQELAAVTVSDRKLATQQADAYTAHVEASRDLTRHVVHIDMDAFYAAVEILDQPELADKPMAVGGMGMLSTSNYVARKYGVRAGMPGFIGKKLCPDLVLVKSHFDRYRAASQEVRAILAMYDPDFEAVGLDESFLDVTEFVEQRQREGKIHSYPIERPEPDKCSGVKQYIMDGDTFAGGHDQLVSSGAACSQGDPAVHQPSDIATTSSVTT